MGPGLCRQAHRLAQRLAEQVQRVRHPAGAKQRGGVQDRTQLPHPEASRGLRQGDGPIQQGLVQVVRDQPHPAVAQGALAEGGLLGPETVQHQLPALVHHGEIHRVAIADVTLGLQQRRESQQPRRHWRLASRCRAIALGQRILPVRVEERMAVLTQQDKKLPRLAGAYGDFLLVRGQGNGRVPHNVLLMVVGHGSLLHLSEPSPPLLSTLYKPLPKHLISVLGVLRELPGSLSPGTLITVRPNPCLFPRLSVGSAAEFGKIMQIVFNDLYNRVVPQ